MERLENWYKELGKERKIFVYVISCLLLAAFGFGLIPFLILIYLELGIPNNNAKKIIGYFFAAPIALYLAGVTIAGVIWLNIEYPVVIFNEILAIPIYFLAKKLDNKHLIKQPDDRGYKWGYFQGITAIVWGVISLLVLAIMFVMLGSKTFLDIEINTTYQSVGIVISIIYMFIGYAVCLRDRGHLIALSIFSLNPIIWVINYFYIKRRPYLAKK